MKTWEKIAYGFGYAAMCVVGPMVLCAVKIEDAYVNRIKK